MELSFSSLIEDTFVLGISDGEYDRLDQTERFGDEEQIRCDSKSHDNNSSAKVQLENYCDFKDLKLHYTQESEYSALPEHSPEKPQTTTITIENDEMANVSELIKQLVNSKVVIERMCENSQRDLTYETKWSLPKKLELKDSIQRYCPECKTLNTDKHGVIVKKFCPKAKTALKYVCSKCNLKQYSSYETLRVHWNQCRQTGDTYKKFYLFQRRGSIQRYCPKCETLKADKHQIMARKSCPKCETTLMYKCSKCNSKQYLSYKKFIKHWDECVQAGHKLFLTCSNQMSASNKMSNETNV